MAIEWTGTKQLETTMRLWVQERDSKGMCTRDATPEDLATIGYVPADSAHFDRVARVIRAMAEWTPECRADLLRAVASRWPELDPWGSAKSAAVEKERDAAIARAERAEAERDELRETIGHYELARAETMRERDALRAEVEKMRAVVEAAKAWRKWQGVAIPNSVAAHDRLIAALDALAAPEATESRESPEEAFRRGWHQGFRDHGSGKYELRDFKPSPPGYVPAAATDAKGGGIT